MGAVATAAANDNRLASELEAAEAVDEDQHGETVIAPEPAPTPVPAPVEKGLLLSAVYVLGSVLLFLTQGLGMNLALANLTQVQGSLSATSIEAGWLSAAYMAPNVSLSIALVKIRAQYGLRRFAEISIAGFVGLASRREDIKRLCIALAWVMIVLIGISRIYLGVHWPTDVLGGWLLGVAWSSIAIAWLGRKMVASDPA